MSDRYDIEYAFNRFLETIPESAWSDLMKTAEDRIWSEVGDLSTECEKEHIRGDYESDEDWVEVTALSEFLDRKLSKLRMGTYDEQRDGNLLEVLEEIERILR